jgi:hypothetical protein
MGKRGGASICVRRADLTAVILGSMFCAWTMSGPGVDSREGTSAYPSCALV